jgi:hypothetical protein
MTLPLAASASPMVSRLSFTASSMKPQVLTITRSAPAKVLLVVALGAQLGEDELGIGQGLGAAQRDEVQALTANLLRPESERDTVGVDRDRAALSSAYTWIDRHLEGRTWAAGGDFSMADCAAAPALFYAVTHVPMAAQHTRLAAYFECLLARPSVARTIDEARPFFQFYPGRSGLSAPLP